MSKNELLKWLNTLPYDARIGNEDGDTFLVADNGAMLRMPELEDLSGEPVQVAEC